MSDARKWYSSLNGAELRKRLSMWEAHAGEPNLDEKEQKRRNKIVRDIRKMIEDRAAKGIHG